MPSFPLDFKGFEMKHISELKIGDIILIHIPTVCFVASKVHFINLDKRFVFVDGEEDDVDEYNHAFFPNEDGFYRILLEQEKNI